MSPTKGSKNPGRTAEMVINNEEEQTPAIQT